MGFSIEDISDKIINLAKEIKICEVKNCTCVTEKFDFDSLEFMTFISAIENEFNFQFPEDITFEELNNFNNIVNFILKI